MAIRLKGLSTREASTQSSYKRELKGNSQPKGKVYSVKAKHARDLYEGELKEDPLSGELKQESQQQLCLKDLYEGELKENP